jgi:hypothetical protein
MHWRFADDTNAYLPPFVISLPSSLFIPAPVAFFLQNRADFRASPWFVRAATRDFSFFK